LMCSISKKKKKKLKTCSHEPWASILCHIHGIQTHWKMATMRIVQSLINCGTKKCFVFDSNIVVQKGYLSQHLNLCSWIVITFFWFALIT
jgi:hypothetical protein